MKYVMVALFMLLMVAAIVYSISVKEWVATVGWGVSLVWYAYETRRVTNHGTN